MPVEPGGRKSAATRGTDGALFAQVPLWERTRKGRRASRPASDPAMDAGEAAPTGLGEPVDASYETQPADVGVETPKRIRRDPPVGGILLGAAALAVIAAAGWYASRPHERGVPELVPGGPTARPAAYAIAAPPGASPSSPAAPAPEKARPAAPDAQRSTTPATPPKEAKRTNPRVRPAPSAADAGANAAATAAPTITPPTPGSPSTDPMTVNPAPTRPAAPAESPPSAPGSPATQPTPPAPTPNPEATP